MDLQNEKCVMVIDENLPLGLIANTAAILGITLGKEMPEVVGAKVTDQSGGPHSGIITFPVPVLKGTPKVLREIREKLCRPEFRELYAVDFTDLAQGCRTYDEFIGRWPKRRKAPCSISALPSAGRKRRSTGSPAVCRCCADPSPGPPQP